MDERQIRTILTVMNISAPFEAEWCAWQPEKGWLDEEYKIRDHWRFYLVDDDSELHSSESGNIIWGDR